VDRVKTRRADLTGNRAAALASLARIVVATAMIIKARQEHRMEDVRGLEAAF
jgi:hypothetical protein